jgi:hypothetical protein
MFKRIRIIAAMVGMLCVVGLKSHLFAQETQQKGVKVGFGFLNFDYKEQLTLPYKSQERGTVPQISVGLVIENPILVGNKGFVEGTFKYAFGSIVYDGSTQNGTPVMATSGFRLLELDGEFHYLPFRGTAHKIGGVAGLSYSLWSRNVANSYTENYSWFTLKLGPEGSFNFNSDTSVSLKVLGTTTFFGVMKLDSYNFYLKPRLGTDISLSFRTKLGEGEMTIQPWLRSYGFGASDTVFIFSGNSVYAAYEPASDTITSGITASYTVPLKNP